MLNCSDKDFVQYFSDKDFGGSGNRNIHKQVRFFKYLHYFIQNSFK